jgi:hypothetical protein
LEFFAKVLSSKYDIDGQGREKGTVEMSSKSTIERIRNLEEEKLSLIAEVENLKRIADARANSLANEIAALRAEIKSLSALIGEEKPLLPSNNESIKEKNLVIARELVEKTINASNQLGDQVFAASPFSQSYDKWLADMRQIVSDFELNSPLKADEQFAKDRSQILLAVESVLAQKRIEESNVGAVAKALADNNHLLVETDKEYAEKARELTLKRDSETERLSNCIRDLERAVQSQEEDNSKRKILKKKTDDTTPQMRLKLKSAKTELEEAQQNFAVEQDKLHDDYEKKKQDTMTQVESERRELDMLETDTSIEARQVASKALADAVNAFVQRTSSIA